MDALAATVGGGPGNASDAWIARARAAALAIGEREPFDLQRARIQEAFRTASDAYLQAARRRSSSKDTAQ
jgi:hypothetical protein